MAVKKVVAFADEFGNNSFDFLKEDVSTHFIIASVIINANEIDTINSELEKIRKKHFQTGEMKSQNIGKNHKRRETLLQELTKLSFSIYAVVVDKKKLYGEGFKYKQSFYKYLNGILYKELYRTFPELELIVDEHGANDFMRSFKKYVETNHIRTLFTGSDFNIEKSQNELGIQLADIIAGTLGYIFDETKKGEHSTALRNLLNDKTISINQFPKTYEITQFEEKDIYAQSEYDENIAKLSLQRFFDFLDTTSGDSQDKIDSINFLKLLIRYHESIHPKKYTTATEFKRHLNVIRERNISDEKFTNLIGKLRDKGVLIASSRDGYKIPTTVAEIQRYIRHGNNIVFPLLRRIEECRSAIKLATNNSLDVLDYMEFNRLKTLLEKTKTVKWD
jgi:tetrahydromethanopterin S-methyltransferase subunit G